MEKVQFLMDRILEPLGDYRPRKRCLIADCKDRLGNDLNRDLTVWHSRGASDKSLVESVHSDLARQGYTLTALAELLEDGSAKALYLAPGYVEEAIHEMGLTVPVDMPAAMHAAGVCPVNWEELTSST